MSARRGPYRKNKRLAVTDLHWKAGDTLIVGRTRWLIKDIRQDSTVVLHSANTVNHLVEWNTTLDRLPEKVAA